jgi:transposase
MKVKMEQQASKDIYSKRKVIVEPVFGQIKNSGFRGFSVRGNEKSPVSFQGSVRHTISKKLPRPLLRE